MISDSKTRYVQELNILNSAYRSTELRGFRTTEVFCVDKFGRDVTFSKPSDIPLEMDRLMQAFAEEFKNAGDLPSLALCLARFFYVFIAVHPFADGNRRTAFAFLAKRAAEKSYDIQAIDTLRCVLLQGDVAEEMQKLRSLFMVMLKPQAEGDLSCPKIEKI
ncbi:MAG: Fic family protein [Alphaproteobacteria bacterium]